MSKKYKIIIGVVVAFWAILIIGICVSGKNAETVIKNDSNFHYKTSLTSNYDRSDKAKVYSTKMSVRETAKYIFNQERPSEYSDLNNEEAIQLIYDDKYILVYSNEDGDTYVQISSRKYIHRNGYNTIYRPRSSIISLYTKYYIASKLFNRDSNRYGRGFYNPKPFTTGNTNKSTTTNKNTSTTTKKNDTNSSKIKTDKNSSSKIKTKNNTTKSTNNNSNSTSAKTTKTKSKSFLGGLFGGSKSGSIRSGSTSSRSRLGGGTSFGK